MVYFANDKIFTQKANSHVALGDLVGGWGVNGSMWSVNLSGNHAVTAYGIAGDFNMYASHIHLRQAGNDGISWRGLDIDIRNSIFSGIANDAGAVGFNAGGVSLQLRDVIFHNLYEVSIRKSPSVASDIRWHNLTYGNNSGGSDVIITDLLATSISSYEIRLFDAQVITATDPGFHFSTVLITDAGGIIIERYTCNIHVTDKDGVDLQNVTILCEDQTTAEEFNVSTDAGGDIVEQTIDYKKWAGTLETLTDYSPHKFTFTHADYPDLTMSAITVDHPIVWEIDMGQSTADLTAISQGVIEDNNLDHLLKVAVSNRDTIPEVVDDSILANLMTKTDGDTSDFDHATDSLEAIRDKQNVMHGGLHH